MNDLKLSLELV